MTETHKAMIRELRPTAQEIIELGDGDINEAIMVDNREVFRFPKIYENRAVLRYEAEVLRELQGKVSLAIPQVITLAEDAGYGVFSYVPGNVLSGAEIDALSEQKQTALGHGLANFMIEINAALPMQQAISLRNEYYPQFETDSQYYDQMFRRGKEHRNPYIKQYEQHYQRLCKHFGEALPEANVVAHGDLHSGNLIFSSDGSLHGIIDFSDCGPVNIYSDLRQMYRLGDAVIQTILTSLGNTFGPLDINVVRLWAITHEFSILMRPGALEDTNQRAKMSRKLLTHWLGPDWSHHD